VELRNRIYEDVLVDEEIDDVDWDKAAIHIDGSTREPGLLKACKQIRREARKMYYSQNMFSVIICDLKLMPHASHPIWEDTRETEIVLGGGHDWDNLMEWLRAYHAGTISATPDFEDSCSPTLLSWDFLEVLFNVANKSRKPPWEVVSGILQSFESMFNRVQESDRAFYGR
jgi:hypothetical protein